MSSWPLRTGRWRRWRPGAQKGLAINDPQQTLHLRLYRGGSTVSALQVACILYVGVQLLPPGEDAGIDPGR